jgi:hypothetical protein
MDGHGQARPSSGEPVGVAPGVEPPERAVALLARYGLPLVRQSIANDIEGALEAADSVGYPVVAKGVLPGRLHKADLGAVVLNIQDKVSMRSAVESLVRRVPGASILVQQMVPAGVEMIVGIQRDPQFGPVVLIGAGGTQAEIVDDKLIAIPPFDGAYIDRRIRELKVHRLLRGTRGAGSADIGAFVKVVLQVADVAVQEARTIESLDLNPVIVLPEGRGCTIVDWALIGQTSRR